jgi:hypothetical protein
VSEIDKRILDAPIDAPTDPPSEVVDVIDTILNRVANPSPSGEQGRPPSNISGCRVYLGSRRVEHFIGGTVLQFRHLYINIYNGPSDYALIEAGPKDGKTVNGITEAKVNIMKWDKRGIHWDITPKTNCLDFIDCLKRRTFEYDSAAYPYDYRGPNSNSFIWWILNKCGLDISFMFSGWPYLGIDYWEVNPLPMKTLAF